MKKQIENDNINLLEKIKIKEDIIKEKDEEIKSLKKVINTLQKELNDTKKKISYYIKKEEEEKKRNEIIDKKELEIKNKWKILEEKEKLLEKQKKELDNITNKNEKIKKELESIQKKETKFIKKLSFNLIGNDNFGDKIHKQLSSKNNMNINLKLLMEDNNEEIKKKLTSSINVNNILNSNKNKNNLNKSPNKKYSKTNIHKTKEKNKIINEFNPKVKLIPSAKKAKKNQKEEPIKIFKFPILKQLKSGISQNFKNAVLQCLSQTEELTNYFLKESNNNLLKNKDDLCPSYSELIQNLWSNNKEKSYSSTSFLNNIEKISEKYGLSFKKNEIEDIKDFIIFILEQLHRELKLLNKSNIKKENNEPLDQYDKNNTYKHFFNKFQEDSTIISQIFFGIKESKSICQNCIKNFKEKNYPICYNYEIFNCLIFPLEEISKQMNKINITLNDCFNFIQKEELFSGDNKNYCNKCNQFTDATYISEIYNSPNVLILILDRGKENIKDIKINFNEFLDITQYVLEKKSEKIIYNLYGVISNINKKDQSPNFVPLCKSPVNKKWYNYNDNNNSPITNIQKDVIENGIPYILFYKKE